MYLTREKPIFLILIILVLSPGLTGCSARQHRSEVTKPVFLPVDVQATDEFTMPDRWWESFNDPELNDLINRSLKANFTLKTAWARFDQAYAFAAKVKAAHTPQVSLDASSARSRSSILNDAIYGNQFSLYLTTTYEVDLWNKLDSIEQAAELDLKASRYDVETAAMTLASQVTTLWFSIIEQYAQLGLLMEQLEVAETYQELAELRFSQGLASALDVYQQRQQVVATRAKIPLVEARLKINQHQLAVLLAQPPNAVILSTKDVLPDIEPIPVDGLLVHLLERRPDIKAGRERVAAADLRVAAAADEQLAVLRLTGRAGYQNSEAGDLFDLWYASVSATVQHTLADGGLRTAEQERTRAITRVLIQQYGQTVLNAMQEVESAMVQEQRQRTYLEELKKQLDLARATLAEARSRYVNGLSDYLPVLVALQGLQQLERTHISARRDLIAFRIQLYRSLGGSWMASLGDESI